MPPLQWAHLACQISSVAHRVHNLSPSMEGSQQPAGRIFQAHCQFGVSISCNQDDTLSLLLKGIITLFPSTSVHSSPFIKNVFLRDIIKAFEYLLKYHLSGES